MLRSGLCFALACLAAATLPGCAQPLALGPQRVDLTLGVMSRCPDAISAEASLDRVVALTNDKIRLQFSYIGEIDEEEDTGVRCMHGPQECWGNIHQLCVQHTLRPSRAGKDFDLSPSQAQRKVWDFVQCQNYDGPGAIGKVGLVQQCLSTVKGPRWEEDGVRECVEGPLGKQLLQQSVRDSKSRHIVKSATIQLQGKTICIRDGGRWQDCPGGHETGDFVRVIEAAWKQRNGY
ncbi:unnamed protein product [Parajaminaea phylloscopi]